MSEKSIIVSIIILLVLAILFGGAIKYGYYNTTLYSRPSPDLRPIPPSSSSSSSSYTSTTTTSTNTSATYGKCFVGGCSGQICSDQEGAMSTCEYREEYACYKNAKCERQGNGQCGWTQTGELSACISSSAQTGGGIY